MHVSPVRSGSKISFLIRLSFLILTFCVIPGGLLFAQAPNSSINDPAIDARVNQILSKMSLEEKVGQLVQYSAGQPTGPGTGRSDYEEMIAREQVGSFLNVNEPAKINAYQRIAMEKTRLHIPILFSLD